MNWIKASNRLPTLPEDWTIIYVVITTVGADLGRFHSSGKWENDKGESIKVHYWLEPENES